MALFDRAAPDEQIKALFNARLKSSAVRSAGAQAFWSFPIAEVVSEQSKYPLSSGQPVQSPLERALTEVCHVLLNSNEFVYVD